QRPQPDAEIAFGGVVSLSPLLDHLLFAVGHYGVGPAYSVFILANFTTFAHFSVSSAMSLPNSAGEPTSAVPPPPSRSIRFEAREPDHHSTDGYDEGRAKGVSC